MSRPKILFVSHGMHLGGVERSLVALLESIPAERAEVSLFLLEHRGELMAAIPPHVRLLAQEPACMSLQGPLWKSLLGRHFMIGASRMLARAIIAGRRLCGLPGGFLLARSHRYALPFLPHIPGQYDLAVGFLTPHDLVASHVRAKRKAAWIHTDYAAIETGVAASFEEAPWAEMDAIIAVSPDVSTSFSQVFPRLSDRVRVIENVLDSTWVKRMSFGSSAPEVLRDGKLALCSVGRLTHQKAFDEAVLASRRLLDLGLAHRWYVVGFGPDEELIRAKIVEQQMQETFILLGKKTNPYPYMRACDIYVQPSRYEGKAVAVREAQMLGKPVVIAGFSTASSQLEDGVDGIIAGPGVEGLTEALRQVASDPLLRDRLSRGTLGRDYGNLSEVTKVLALLPPDPA